MTRGQELTQLTKFTDFGLKTMDAGAGAVVLNRHGYIHELDPKSGKEHAVNITATGDFPWMMPRWEDVTSRMTNMGISPTGKRVVVEARGRNISPCPSEKGDVRNLTNSSGSADARSGLVSGCKFISYFSDRSVNMFVCRSAHGLTPPSAKFTLDHPTTY